MNDYELSVSLYEHREIYQNLEKELNKKEQFELIKSVFIKISKQKEYYKRRNKNICIPEYTFDKYSIICMSNDYLLDKKNCVFINDIYAEVYGENLEEEWSELYRNVNDCLLKFNEEWNSDEE